MNKWQVFALLWLVGAPTGLVLLTYITVNYMFLRRRMTYWVIGGEFTSLNFHSLIPGTTIVQGPFNTRAEAQEYWKEASQQYRSKAGYRFLITEETS